MENGVHGVTGELVPLPAEKERVQKNESVTTLPHNTEGKAAILMDLMMINPRVVTAELVLVYKSFSTEHPD